MQRSLIMAIAVWALFALAACRSASTTGLLAPSYGGPERLNSGSRSSVVTASELVELRDRSLDDALRQLRPEFLRVRTLQPGEAARPSVCVDEKYAGSDDVLRLIPIGVVGEVAFLTPVAAESRYGSLCVCGAGVARATALDDTRQIDVGRYHQQFVRPTRRVATGSR